MNTSSFRLAFSGLLLAGGLAAAGTASAMVLDTRDNKANATLQFTADAYNAATQAGITFGAMGTTSAGAGTKVGGVTVPSFILPVTEADVSLGWNLKLSPNAGEAIGSALSVRRGERLMGLANFSLDFTSDKVYADVIYNGVTTNMAIFSFKEQTDLKIGLSGLNLTLYNTLGDLKMTDAAKNTFASYLGLSSAAANLLASKNWGTVKVDITTAIRKPALSGNPFTAAMMVPEPSTYAMMGLGLVGIGMLARRKARQA